MWTRIFGCLWSFGVAGVFVFAGSFPKKPPGGTGCFRQNEKFYALLVQLESLKTVLSVIILTIIKHCWVMDTKDRATGPD